MEAKPAEDDSVEKSGGNDGCLTGQSSQPLQDPQALPQALPEKRTDLFGELDDLGGNVRRQRLDHGADDARAFIDHLANHAMPLLRDTEPMLAMVVFVNRFADQTMIEEGLLET